MALDLEVIRDVFTSQLRLAAADMTEEDRTTTLFDLEGRPCSFNDLVKEVEDQTDFGMEFLENMIGLAAVDAAMGLESEEEDDAVYEMLAAKPDFSTN